MKIDSLKRNEIIFKKEQLAEIKRILKSEFIGIDKVIDNVIDSFEPWFIFPECVVKPITINLWGMTGTGKSSLVKRLVELTDTLNRFVHIDIAEYNDKYRSTLKNYITDDIIIDDKGMIFCFDEFQFARTIDETSKENEKQGTRVLWEFIDSGMIYYDENNKSNYLEVNQYCRALKECAKIDYEIINGVIVNNRKQFLDIMDRNFIIQYSRIDQEEEIKLILPSHIDEVYELSSKRFPNRRTFKEYIEKLDIFDTIEFLELILNENKIIKPLDLSNSLIFIIGNLDDAYRISSEVDPDKDADLFHEMTKSICLSTIKTSLCQRFRQEQVSRLGNNHVIYPAFNSQNYRDLISMHLVKSANKFNDLFEIEIDFTQNMNDIIYKESVFPTQGARPVITSINLLVDSYFSKILNDICIKHNDIEKIAWDYESEKFKIKCINNNEVIDEFVYPVELKLENDRKSENLDKNAIIAVHECGHAIVAVMSTKILPKKITCVSANENIAGSASLELPDMQIASKKLLLQKIMISLGGMLAEKLIFGEENITYGSQNDIHSATATANNMIRSWGMGNEIAKLTFPDIRANDQFKLKDKHEKEAFEIIKSCEVEALLILENNKNLLIEMSKELSSKYTLEKEDIKNIIKKYSTESWINNDEFKTKDTYYNFNNILFNN